MASLHRHRGSPYWYVAYSLADGRRVLRSTRQVVKRKALEVARALERISRTARAGELTESKTRAWFNEMLTGTGLAAARHDSVRDFALQWLEGKRLSVSAGSAIRYRSAITLFLDGLGSRADKPISSVTPADIVAYRDERMRSGIAGGTLHHYLKIVRAVFTSARRQGLMLSNPAEAIDLPHIKRNERAVFTVHEVKALIGAAPIQWQTLILVAFYTGARLRDCSRMEWSAVDLAEGFITFRQGKTNKKVVLPIHPALSEHLLERAGQDQCGPLCPLLSATSASALSQQFNLLMRKAGIDSLAVRESRYAFRAKSFHSLRHSFTSTLADAGVSADLRMKLTGHRSLGEHLGYTHMELAALRGAIDLLPRL
jgi:integrase